MCSVQQRLLYQDEQLSITVAMASAAPVVTLIGEIDATNSPALAGVLTNCRQNAHQGAGQSTGHGTGPIDGPINGQSVGRNGACSYIDVDTGALTFIDVSGLRVLVMPMLPAGQRWIRLHNVTPGQRRLLRMMGWYYQPTVHHVPL
ncbi:STAS domain-containing protein [Nonomuraea fuscirosea]|uniref:STAS domain-containing protein n=1 Tax=Nonomuraea fuscirosea TaxID=1291556 RepID=UPI003443858A